ncbi:acyl-CoA N-acyltransferase [Clohesyomyces aquaticus]|uniref:Acyl-CoA N-acyltransferase n=1 Tax=Clohesyomyces aquaticus TaxID=1231657 RepID=A0A1Y1YD82_9PLEO|nr:acyl-CoA N-acyltransferase [Clohesyomyces aquaticus]
MANPPSQEDASFVIRPASSVAEVRDFWWPLMKELGWNRDQADARTHYHVSRNGSDWLMLAPKYGKPEGCCVAFTYPNGTGWVGFFIVNAVHRGLGHGRALLQTVTDSYDAKNISVIGLDGVEEQVKTYERRGFVDIARIKLMTRPSLAEKPSPWIADPLKDDEEMVDSRGVDFEHIRALDLALNGLDRKLLWSEEALFSREDVWAAAIVSRRVESSKKLLGFVLVRRCEHGHRFGPLYAETYQQAALLLRRAMENNDGPDGSMIAEVFGSNPKGMKLFQALGWDYTGLDYHRMWLGGRVPKEQQDGGLGTKNMYAIFDASEG